jgi:hypothetical protein
MEMQIRVKQRHLDQDCQLEVVLGSKIAVNFPGSGWHKGFVKTSTSKRSLFIVAWTEAELALTGNKSAMLYLYKCKDDPHKLTCLSGGLSGASFQPYEARLLFDPTKCLGCIPPQAKDRRLDAALFRAVMENNFEALKDLVCRGADPKAKNGAGLTPSEVAIQNKKVESIRLFLLAGVLPLDKRCLMADHGLSNGTKSSGLAKEQVDALVAAHALPAAWSMR